MNSDQFIRAINQRIAIDGTTRMLNSIENPSGRAPAEWQAELSRWFLSLNSKDKKFVERIISISRESAVFEILTMLDGVNKTLDEDGTLQLNFTKDNGDVLVISDGEFGDLHDQFNLVRAHSPNTKVTTIEKN